MFKRLLEKIAKPTKNFKLFSIYELYDIRNIELGLIRIPSQLGFSYANTAYLQVVYILIPLNILVRIMRKFYQKCLWTKTKEEAAYYKGYHDSSDYWRTVIDKENIRISQDLKKISNKLDSVERFLASRGTLER